jgi:hypothetical protein
MIYGESFGIYIMQGKIYTNDDIRKDEQATVGEYS